MKLLILRLYIFILTIKLRIKSMTDKEFDNLIKSLDYQQTLYALIFRYFWKGSSCGVATQMKTKYRTKK